MENIIIIGSGPSGGRFAAQLTRAGYSCTMLEAGRKFTSKEFPLSELDGSAKLYWGGGIELSTDAKLAFLRAKCVGGTSIVNQALLDEFDDNAWDDWRDRSGIKDLGTSTYKPYYSKVASDLSIQPIEDRYFNKNTKVFVDAFTKNGLGYSRLNRGQKDCALDSGNDCMACLCGCPRNSKQSSMVTGITTAESKGMTLKTEFEVTDLIHSNDGVTVRGIQRGQKRELKAKRVVLAAGSFGSTQIMLRSGFKSQLPALGKGITAHPQFMTYAFYDSPIDAHKGAFQAVKSYDPALRKRGLKLENVFAAPIATSMLFSGMGKEHLARMKKYRYVASMEVAIRDENSGTLDVDKNGKLIIKKSMTDVDWAKVHDGLDLVKNLFHSVNARETEACMQVFGLHLMGGCALGSDPKTSVVDPEFKVHGLKNITIADSSVFPSAPGINPSYTIMALSEKASENIIKGGRS
ncbi:MAG: GMC family oxidoreductase [Xanthomonadaceae bacterium]|nr:GMC family oxidoreductase [Xanthomonadaceae bacterium]